MTVPTAALRTLQTVPKTISRTLPKGMTVHGLLAADLALDKSSKYAEWDAVVPTMEDFETMPILWDARLQELLPSRSRDLLRTQKAKLERDWAIVSAAFPSAPALALETYTYAWLLVNTRTFYHVTPRTEKLPRDDHMVLQPVADLFNHAAGEGTCAVSFDGDGFTVSATCDLPAGVEVYICYGGHSNDFLLLEYGFVLPDGE
ncbi:MAG: SET domain-containing protein-lysine N-methyltransferase, partial [Thaumarchaeota archaeon]|nr:SET domain-containing protein-lysine N-methyltransferase [Nitrososphaerota archaeon]